MKHNFLLLFFMIAVTSCSSMRGSLLTGVGVGAATGAGAGVLMKSKDRGQVAVTSALIGAVVGGISSYFLHKGVKAKEARIRRETLFNLDKNQVSTPRGFTARGAYGHGVSMPMVDSEWIETQVKGKTLIEGHRIWRITEDAQWVPSSKKSK